MRNAKWVNTEHTRLDVEIQHPLYGWIWFAAADGDPTTQQVFDSVVNGAAGAIDEYVAPVETVEHINIRILQQIDTLERKEQLPRPLREMLLARRLAPTMGWYARVKAVDDAVAALRATLR
jgi:hypothetical protein